MINNNSVIDNSNSQAILNQIVLDYMREQKKQTKMALDQTYYHFVINFIRYLFSHHYAR